MTVIIILVILGTMLYPATRGVVAKVEAARCAANLRNLHIGVSSYLSDHDRIWPQISTALSQTDPEKYAAAWVDALDNYGVSPETWICPTIQKILGSPGYLGEDARVDYIANQYIPKMNAPYTYPTDPWFLETGNAHGRGNLIIFADGSIKPLSDVTTTAQ